MPNLISILEEKAKKKLTTEVYDHIAGGSGDEITLKRNHDIYMETALITRVLKGDVSPITSINVLGIDSKVPILIAPMAFHTLVSPEGEVATARAAQKAGCIMIVSMMSGITLEKISQSSTTPLWFQLHIHKEFRFTEQLIKRAENSGYKGIVITVDVPQKVKNSRDIKNHFNILEKCTPANFSEKKIKGSSIIWEGTEFNSATSWEDILRIRSITKLPIILKGIMHPSDALKAVDAGIDAIVVSNHGGRQLDGAAATLEVLPEIAKAVGNRVSILIDGGIQSGSDIVKAISLGADAVLIGRPILWGLAVGGEQGVGQVIECISEEMALTMRLIGCNTIADIKNNNPTLSHLKYLEGSDSLRNTEIHDLKKQINLLIDQQVKILDIFKDSNPADKDKKRWPLSKL